MSDVEPVFITEEDFFYGWDLLYKTIHDDINKKSDWLIVLAHFLFTKHYCFRCVGIGEDSTMPKAGTGSELLPDNWNEDEKKYSLRYVHDDQLYLLLGYLTEDAFIINLVNMTSKKLTHMCIEADKLVAEITGCITTLMPTANDLVDRFRRELLVPVFTGLTRNKTTQTTLGQPEDSDDVKKPRQAGAFSPEVNEHRPFGFPDLGRNDLEPMGGSESAETLPSPSSHGSEQPPFDLFGPPDPNLQPTGGDYYM